MSLLLSLINYSSSMQGQYSLSLPNFDAKDNRSRSLCISADEQQAKKSKTTSKSLSKMLNQKPQQNIDPKTRILHRIGHSLTIKCKKHFYAFFVTLQTIKKKDLYLTPQGEFEKVQNRKLVSSQSEQKNQNEQKNRQSNIISKKKESNLDEKKQVLNRFVSKLEELNKLIQVKNFEQHTKAQFFHSIKTNLLYRDSAQSIVSNLQKCIRKLNCYRFLKKLKKINQYAFKIQILSTLITTLNKNYCKVNPFDEFDIKQNAFQVLKTTFKHQKNYTKSQYSSATIQTNQDTSLSNLCTSGLNLFSNSADLEQKENVCENNKSSKKMEPNLSNQSSQFSIKFPLENLHAKISGLEQRKFEKNGKSMLKSYQIKVCLEEKPMIVSQKIKAERSSNFCNKIAKNYMSASVNDKDEEFNTIFTSMIKRNTFSSRLKESKVTPYISKKVSGRSQDKKMSSNEQNEDQRTEDFTISQISGITLLKTKKSTSTLMNEKSLSFSSAIGTQCVNFKNSLVQQRQSLRESDKNFTKKKPANLNKSDVQGGVFSKSFLRSTADNKPKAKAIDPVNWERTYSSNKGSELLIRQEAPFTDVKPLNRTQEVSWNRIQSQERQKNEQRRVDTGMDIAFMAVNMSMFSNQNIYPTRDISSGITYHPVNSTPYIQKQTTDKSDKQKSFLKLLSKKDKKMTNKN